MIRVPSASEYQALSFAERRQAVEDVRQLLIDYAASEATEPHDERVVTHLRHAVLAGPERLEAIA